MLDPRLYRAAFAPAILAVIVVAFSLGRPPGPATTSLAPDAFDGPRALDTLSDLTRDFPLRRPGTAGDARLANHVRGVFRLTGLRTQVRRFPAMTVDGRRRLRTVVGVRPGLSPRRVVILAHRDSLHPRAPAQLSGTAAVIELARVFAGRTPQKTLVLVSTSGGTGGAAGARQFAGDPGGPVDAVIAVGDLAGAHVREPQVVPWSNARGLSPLTLRRTAESALRSDAGVRVRRPGSAEQWARLAMPLTLGEQGEVAAEGLPAVLVQRSGERGPADGRRVSEQRLRDYGRSVLRTVTAIDQKRGSQGSPESVVLTGGKVLPLWAVRLLTGCLLLPLVLAAIDSFARVRRRRQPVGTWLVWTLSSAAPFALASGMAIAVATLGLLPAAPSGPVAPGAVAFGGAGAASLAATILAGILGWLVLRPMLLRWVGVRGERGSAGPGAGTALVLAALGVGVWIANPFACALLLPALHAWLFVIAPEVRMRRPVVVVLVAVGLLPLALVALYYTRQFGLGPLEFVWSAFLLVAGGEIGALGVLGWSLLLGSLACVLRIGFAQRIRPPDPSDVTIRGPLGYAGPGSLGGTESAMRR